ncbi:hypothetical protein niasHS_008217 [Heterodera schachtii]|uniref:Uncharacterized protein n=1 Tax=Heterodera schachtii TaxID=97005 RepID=A0ABD2J161_HETSC
MLIQIHRLNASISLFLALCLNAILILLVVKRSPKEMKVYKRILIQTALVDIALSVLSFLSQDVGISTNGWTLVLSVSQFSDYLSFSAQFGKLLINSWLIMQFFSVFGLCVQFVYRFLVLNRFVHQNLDKNSTRRQQINRQITINLIIQAFIPLAMNIINIIFTFEMVIFEFQLSPTLLIIQMCVTLPLHWFPVLNPLVSIFCVGDYRKAAVNFIRHTICRRQNAVAQQPIPMNNQQNNNQNAQLPIVAP